MAGNNNCFVVYIVQWAGIFFSLYNKMSISNGEKHITNNGTKKKEREGNIKFSKVLYFGMGLKVFWDR